MEITATIKKQNIVYTIGYLMYVPHSDWFKKPVEALARSQKDCDTAELWRAEPGKRNSDAVNHAAVEFVMDARSASLLPVLHPSSQVHCERYY